MLRWPAQLPRSSEIHGNPDRQGSGPSRLITSNHHLAGAIVHLAGSARISELRGSWAGHRSMSVRQNILRDVCVVLRDFPCDPGALQRAAQGARPEMTIFKNNLGWAGGQLRDQTHVI